MRINPALEFGDGLIAFIVLHQAEYSILDRVARRTLTIAAGAQLGDGVLMSVLVAPFAVRVGEARVVASRRNDRREDFGRRKRVRRRSPDVSGRTATPITLMRSKVTRAPVVRQTAHRAKSSA